MSNVNREASVDGGLFFTFGAMRFDGKINIRSSSGLPQAQVPIIGVGKQIDIADYTSELCGRLVMDIAIRTTVKVVAEIDFFDDIEEVVLSDFKYGAEVRGILEFYRPVWMLSQLSTSGRGHTLSLCA